MTDALLSPRLKSELPDLYFEGYHVLNEAELVEQSYFKRLTEEALDEIAEKTGTRPKQKRPFVVEGIISMGDEPNGNGRIYPTRVWEKVLKSADFKERLKNRRMTGEVRHPASGQTDLAEISHVVRKVWMEGSKVLGQIEVLDTRVGLDLQVLFNSKIGVGISSRGKGSSKPKGDYEEIQEDYMCETWDFVANQSVKQATPVPVSESLNSTGGMKVNEALQAVQRSESRLQEIGSFLESSNPQQRDRWSQELMEMVVQVSNLGKQDEGVSPFANSVAGDALKLRTKIQEFVPPGTVTEDADSDAGLTDKDEDVVLELNKKNEALEEEVAFWKERAESLAAEAVDEPEGDLDERVTVAEGLAAELGERCNELTTANERLVKRYNASVALTEAVLRRADRRTVVDYVREQIEENPLLEAVRDELMACPSIEAVDRMVDEATSSDPVGDEDLEESSKASPVTRSLLAESRQRRAEKLRGGAKAAAKTEQHGVRMVEEILKKSPGSK